VVIRYQDRPEGSVSKLNTFSDGAKVLKTILRFFRTYRPLEFFSLVSLLLTLLAAVFCIPVYADYLKTGMVERFPTLIVCGFTMIAAIQALFAGMQLQTSVHKGRQDFEMQLNRVAEEKKRKM
jgi:hypothetical protein